MILTINKYFNGLNSLRFFAAFFVLIHHLEQIRFKYGMFNLKEYALFNNGGLAVSFFFVLSGFLISYRLIVEKKKIGTIHIRKFYIRRILRIWPLYFLLVVIGTLILPYFIMVFNIDYTMPYHFRDVIFYYIFFSPFLVNMFFGNNLLEPLWSIGVEEIFYLIWAPLAKYLNFSMFKISVCVIIIKFLILQIVLLFENNELFLNLLKILSFESMSIGAIGAFIVFNLKTDVSQHILFSKKIQLLIYSLIIFRFLGFYLLEQHFVFSENNLFFIHLFYNFLFLWLIVNISLNSKSLINLNYVWLNKLGDISYGIYMYHMLAIFFVILIFKHDLNQMNKFLSSISIYGLVISITILLSFLSKRYFEDYFLLAKKHFNPK